jgi:hypothetical protein
MERRRRRPGGRRRELLGELAATAPQFLEATRRSTKAGLMSPVIERFVPEAV